MATKDERHRDVLGLLLGKIEALKSAIDLAMKMDRLGPQTAAEAEAGLRKAAADLRRFFDVHFNAAGEFVPQREANPLSLSALDSANVCTDLLNFEPGRASGTATSAIDANRMEPFRREQIRLSLSQPSESERQRFLSHYRIGPAEVAAYEAGGQRLASAPENAETQAMVKRLLEPAGAK
ncbi:MAG: hypothetical protein ABSB74_05475 [Tepidisphaeraceae bacterium]